MAKKTLYIPAHIDRDIIAADGTENYSGRVLYLAEIGHATAMAAVPALTVGEWCAIADALNGHYPSYEQGAEGVLRSAWHSVHDSGPECDEKWGVDCAELARHLLALPRRAQAGVYEIARAFWRRGDEVSKHPDYTAAFGALGAKIRPDRDLASIGQELGITEEEADAYAQTLAELRGK